MCKCIYNIFANAQIGGGYVKISTKSIKRYMDSNLMTQKHLASLADVSRVTINNTLLKGSCSTVTAGKIAKALGVDPAEIVEMEDN